MMSSYPITKFEIQSKLTMLQYKKCYHTYYTVKKYQETPQSFDLFYIESVYIVIN